jgi:hypothetical protein
MTGPSKNTSDRFAAASTAHTHASGTLLETSAFGNGELSRPKRSPAGAPTRAHLTAVPVFGITV